MRTQDREHEITPLLPDKADNLLAGLHSIQRPDKFTALAAALGWVEEEVPSYLIVEIMERIKRDQEEVSKLRVFYTTCCSLLLLVVLVFLSVDKLLQTVTIESSRILVGCFWLIVSLGLSIILPTGLLIGYRELESRERRIC